MDGVEEEGAVWRPEAVSYPRTGFKPGDALLPPDALSGASPFAAHDLPPVVEGLTALGREGERLFQKNCAFCHAADGTGRNWIGTFLQPPARNLTDPSVMGAMTRERLAATIRRGLPGTSMPAWGAVLDEGQIEALVEYVGRAFHPLANSLEAAD